MIDDRQHTLFKLLYRLSNKTPVDCAHGLIYVTANMTNGDTELDLDASWNFSYLSDLVRSRLVRNELIVKLSANSFVVISNTSSEERVALLAKTISGTAHQYVPNKNMYKVSVGAVLFDQRCITIPELMEKMCENAFQARSEDTIVYDNLTVKPACKEAASRVAA